MNSKLPYDPYDIGDNEIRVISSSKSTSDDHRRRGGFIWWIVLLVATIVAVGAVCFFMPAEDADDIAQEFYYPSEVDELPVVSSKVDNATKQASYVTISDTVVNNVALTIYTPENATPKLHVGIEAIEDSSAVFVVEAANVRADNGKINGAYIYEGELYSRGQSTSGFCAIINGEITIGVATSTPYLEQAVESDGYFFRQYPLVVGRQLVENKLKLRSLRKALAELDGKIVVVMNHERQSLHDFSQTLIDLGVTNAIYLIGSSAYGFAIDGTGEKQEFGDKNVGKPGNVNYIVWQ